MKKILFVLLLLPFVLEGQIYINSYQFAAANLLIDDYPNAELALSLRKLRNAYTGNCIEVRRSSDSTTQNIGFVNNYLDTSSLKTFCGTTSTDTCWVRQWFDQSGNNRHTLQTTNSQQPIILRGGGLRYATTGELGLFFNGGQSMAIPNSTSTFNFIHNGDDASIFAVYQAGISSNPAANMVILDNCNAYASGSEVGFYFSYADAGANNNAIFSVGANGSVTTAWVNSAQNVFIPNQLNLFSNIIDANNSTAANRSIVKINEGSEIKNNTSTSAVSAANAIANLTFGSVSTTNALFLTGFMAEVIIYNANQTTNRTAISANINNFYSIY